MEMLIKNSWVTIVNSGKVVCLSELDPPRDL
jgi:hypothetical protein